MLKHISNSYCDSNHLVKDIVCSRNDGFFSNLFEIIEILNRLEKNQEMFTKINILNFSKRYSNTGSNSFYDFFENRIEKMNLPIYNCKIEAPLIFNNVNCYDIFVDLNKIKHINGLLKKYIHPNKIIKDKINEFVDDKFKNNKILGVHIRRTDHDHHNKFINFIEYENIINSKISKYGKLFIMTDELNALNYFEDKFKEKIVFIDDIIRSNDNVGLHYKNNVNKNKIGEDVIVESIVLSKCDCIIAIASNVSMFSLCNQNISNFHMLDLNVRRFILKNA